MTKAERLTLTTMTAEAWRTLHEQELRNSKDATSWAHYQELNSNRATSMYRSEWYGLSQFCDSIGIDMNDDTKLDPSVVSIMRECSELMTEAFKIYREFPDYPFRNESATDDEVTTDNDIEEE